MKAKGEAVAERFIWTTQTGQQIPPAAMRTSHLFYSVRMLFNHTAPPAYQIPGCSKRYGGVRRWPMAYKRQAVAAMIAELARRPQGDFQPWQVAQLVQMWQACRAMEIPGLPDRKPA